MEQSKEQIMKLSKTFKSADNESADLSEQQDNTYEEDSRRKMVQKNKRASSYLSNKHQVQN